MLDSLQSSRQDEIFDLAGDLLRAAAEPGHWPQALVRLARILRCQQTMLLRGEGGRRSILATNDLDPDEIRTLAGRRGDPDATWPACPPEHREFVLPGEGKLALLVDRIPFDHQTLALVERLGPLLAEAWRLTDLLAASERRQSWGSRSLEPLATGIVILARDGLVLQSNAAAQRLLASSRELRLEGRRLRSSNVGLERSLARLLTAEIRPEEKRVATESIQLPRSGEGALEVLVVVSPRCADSMPSAVAVALVFDPSKDSENPAVALAARYDLSFEQTQVVGHLLRGRSIPEVARALDVPQEVVTSCLGSVYALVGTTRQVELVKLLLAGS